MLAITIVASSIFPATLTGLHALGNPYQNIASEGAVASDQTTNVSSISTLVEGSDVIVRGVVIQTDSHWNDEKSSIMTDSLLQVHYGISGAAADVLTVRSAGGILWDEGIGLVQSHTPRFYVGEELVLFLSRQEKIYTVVGNEAGKHVVVGDNAVDAATGHPQSLSDLYSSIGTIRSSTAETQSATAGSLPSNWRELEPQQSVRSSSSPDNFVDNGIRWPGDNAVVDFYVNINTIQANGGDGSVTDFRDEIIDAGHTWSKVSTSSIALRYLGENSATETGLNGYNEILFSDAMELGLLGQARVWFNPTTSIIVEADMRINSNHDYDALGSPTAEEVDLQSVVLHEMGHWLSLGHDDDQQAIMYPSISYGVIKRDLHTTDAAGISTIYPCAQASCIQPWVPVDNEVDPDPQPTNQITVEPDQSYSPEFVDETSGIGVKLEIPSGAVSETTTIVYNEGDTPGSSPGDGYEFAGYDFRLEPFQHDLPVDDFSFQVSVPLEVRYGNSVGASMDEASLQLFVERDGQWIDAECGPYQRTPELNQFVVPICELGEFAIFAPMAPETPEPETPEPETPEPATPEPETPEPATPEPETPEPETPEPETPAPETPEPETPEPETPQPETPEPETPQPGETPAMNDVIYLPVVQN